MLLLGDVEEVVLVDGGCGSLTFQLEYHHTIVVTGSEQVDLGMRRDDPEAVVFPLERLDGGSSVEIPYTNRLVLSNRQYQILMGVEQTRRRVLEVPSAGIYFPCLCL